MTAMKLCTLRLVSRPDGSQCLVGRLGELDVIVARRLEEDIDADGDTHELLMATTAFHRGRPATADGRSRNDRYRRPPAVHREQRFEGGALIDDEGEVP